MGVLDPVRLVIENYPEGVIEEFEVMNNPEDDSAGLRRVPFTRVIYIERDDFREDPPKKYYRLAPGREVRLRGAYFVTCTGFSKDPTTGEITELRCTYDPATRGGSSPDGRRVKATLHWVSAAHALSAEVRLYDRLFSTERPGESGDYRADLNPKSLEVLTNCMIEPVVAGAPPGTRYQFERLGYFCVDPDTEPGRLIFNRTVTLKDAWAKIEQRADFNAPQR
jgi:glutaminyl-tRNA synthetase